MVATHIKKKKREKDQVQYALCDWRVILGDTTNTIFVILHLNVSRLSVCSSSSSSFSSISMDRTRGAYLLRVLFHQLRHDTSPASSPPRAHLHVVGMLRFMF